MKIVISPAKALDESSPLPLTQSSSPQFFEEAVKINAVMKTKTKAEIAGLMKLSANLAALNYDRYQQFEPNQQAKGARPAMYMFNGDTYKGLDAYTIVEEKLATAQDMLRILSGMYGVLRPLDLIQPYRLEMGTKLPIGSAKNLYAFWQPKITDALNTEMKPEETLINLASTEYFKALDKTKLNASVITPVFKDFKNGKLKVISFYAKRARGAMARYIIDSLPASIEELKNFNRLGYKYSQTHTKREEEPVFVR